MTRALLCAALLLGATQCARNSVLPEPDAGQVGQAGASGRGAGAAGGGGSGGLAGAGNGTSEAGVAGADPLPPFDAESILRSSCFLSVGPAEVLPVNMLFVIDRSKSMACNPPPITDSASCERDSKRASMDAASKWEITQTALVETLRILPEASRVGVSYFSNDDACGVQAAPNVEFNRNTTPQKDLIRTSLQRVTPGGSTPLVGATILAYQHVLDFKRSGLLPGDSFVVLITDGKQSDACGDPARCTTAEDCTELLIKQEVPRAAAPGVGIRTFVIGVPGSEADSRTLSRIAQAGGTARANCDPEKNCHFDVSSGGDFSLGLRQALSSIVGQTLSCDVPVPAGDLNLLNVLYKPQNRDRILVLQDTRDCDGGANGWQFAENKTRIRLCGDICSRVKADPGGQLSVVVGCPIQGPQ
jgi:von Willebrand factor type A domain